MNKCILLHRVVHAVATIAFFHQDLHRQQIHGFCRFQKKRLALFDHLRETTIRIVKEFVWHISFRPICPSNIGYLIVYLFLFLSFTYETKGHIIFEMELGLADGYQAGKLVGDEKSRTLNP